MDLQTKAEIERVEKKIPAKREYKCLFRIKADTGQNPVTTLVWEDISEVVAGFVVPQFKRVALGTYQLDRELAGFWLYDTPQDIASELLRNSTITVESANGIIRLRVANNYESTTIDLEVWNEQIGVDSNISAEKQDFIEVFYNPGGLLCVLTYYPPEAQ